MIFLAIMLAALPLVIVGAILDERRDQRAYLRECLSQATSQRRRPTT